MILAVEFIHLREAKKMSTEFEIFISMIVHQILTSELEMKETCTKTSLNTMENQKEACLDPFLGSYYHSRRASDLEFFNMR
ncbi:hypothetical protein Trydic_g12537 [Trypoxylus dichotomus]